jgi:hypothetical protein
VIDAAGAVLGGAVIFGTGGEKVCNTRCRMITGAAERMAWSLGIDFWLFDADTHIIAATVLVSRNLRGNGISRTEKR